MSDDEELLFGLLGTQFNVDADIDTENRRQKLKRKAIDEEVTDEKGRALRFHGAFTGGFNAGYFNTVGSKEGFVPQQYVSQGRQGTKSIRQFKPEDFMDEEDFGEHGIAPKLLKTKAVFDDEDMRKHYQQSLGSNSILGDALKDILVPQRLTVGMILLRKLGYMASRGIGETEADEESDNDEILTKKSEKFDYEAEEIYRIIGQKNKFGLGYSGITLDLETRPDKQAVNFGHKGKRGIKGTAFGVGLEEDEEDLEDFYSGDSMTKYNFEIVEDDEKESNFGWTAPKNIQNTIMAPGMIMNFHLAKQVTNITRIVYEPPRPSRFYMPIYPVNRESEKVEDKRFVVPRSVKLMPDQQQSVLSLLSPADRARLPESRPRRSQSRWGDQVEPKATPQPKRTSWQLSSSLGAMFQSAGRSTETEDIDHCLVDIGASSTTVVKQEESDTRQLAAAADNYGFLTRVSTAWHPDKLLCKRFNVADPYPGDSFTGVPDYGKLDEKISNTSSNGNNGHITEGNNNTEINNADTNNNLGNKFPSDFTQDSKQTQSEQSSKTDEVVTVAMVTVSVTTIVPDMSDKPRIDLFKSVFADSDAEFSSSEDEGNVDNQLQEESNKNVTRTASQPEEPQSIVSSLERALFSMIGGSGTTDTAPTTVAKQQQSSMTSARIYGPSLPPGFVSESVAVEPVQTVVNTIISRNINLSNSSQSDDLYDYKEKSELKSKRNKKEKKSKSKKKKSKKQKSHN